MTKITIDRQRWLRGEGYELSRLLRSSDKKMCCFGFLCKQAGLEDKQILDKDTLHSVFMGPNSFNNEEQWVRNAYAINDSTTISDEQRELILTGMFKANGFELEFIN